MKYLANANLYRQKVDLWLPGTGGGSSINSNSQRALNGAMKIF